MIFCLFLDKFAGMEMKGRYSKALRYIVSAAIAAVLLYFSFREVRWDDFISGLRSCRWRYILVSMAAGVLAFYVRALRWRGLLLPIDRSIRRKTVFNAINIGYIANFVFPRIGEFVRCGVITGNSAAEEDGGNSGGAASDTDMSGLARKKASYDKVLGTVVLERSWDMVTMLVFLLALLAFRWSEFGTFFIEKIWRPMEDTLDFSLWWIAVAVAFMAVFAVWVIVKFRNTSKIAGKVYGLLRGLVSGIGSCARMEHKWLFFAYTAVIWGLYWLMSASTMWALPDLDSLGAVDALILMVAGSLGWLVPVPGGFGAFHYIVSLALGTIYGIPFELGIIFATLSHESQAITMAVCGGISYVSESICRS